MRPLRPRDLTAFFAALGPLLPAPVRIVLTGGSAAMVFGGVRPTGDIDFGIAAAARHLSAIEAAIEAAAREVGVAVQYSTDIDRWSLVAIPPNRFRTVPWRRMGRLSVHLLHPACWAVYKLARYLDSDADDLLAVLRRERVAPARLARLCGECLRTSPRSTQLFAFRRHVEHFFATHGPRIWGVAFRAARTIEEFHRAAGISRKAGKLS